MRHAKVLGEAAGPFRGGSSGSKLGARKKERKGVCASPLRCPNTGEENHDTWLMPPRPPQAPHPQSLELKQDFTGL